MANYQIEIKGLAQLQKALRNYPQIAEPIEQRAMAATAAVLAKYTTKSTVPWVTGSLAQTFQFVLGRLQAVWRPTVKYAGWVEFGRGWVYPVNARALSWVTKSGGGYVTAKSGRKYYRSGTTDRVFAMSSRPSKPNPYMERIRDASTPEIQNLFRQALSQVVTAIANQTNA